MSPHQGLDLFNDSGRLDSLHAAEIDRAGSFEAGAAVDLFANHAVNGSDGTGQGRFGGSKESYRGNSEDGSEMHRSGVVAHHDVAALEVLDQTGDRGFADEVLFGFFQ